MPRIKKSLAQHLLAGTQPQYSTQDISSFPTCGLPKVPKGLSPVGEEVFKRMRKQLVQRGTITAQDADALRIYSETFASWIQAGDEVAKYGLFVDEEFMDRQGDVHTRRVQNPAAKLHMQLANVLRAYQIQFSATPASREKAKRVAAEPKKEPEREKTPEEIAREEQQKRDDDFLASSQRLGKLKVGS